MSDSPANFSELVKNLDKVTISRDVSEDGIEELIGKAVLNGYKITRTPKRLTLFTESGPVIDKTTQSDEPLGESGQDFFKSDLPVAAIVSFAGEESHEFEAYGTDETDLTYKDDVEKGDKVVLKSDAEDAIQQSVDDALQQFIAWLDDSLNGVRGEIEELEACDVEIPEDIMEQLKWKTDNMMDETESVAGEIRDELQDSESSQSSSKSVEDAIQEARRNERQKILDKIEGLLEENQEMKDRLLPIADNAVHGELRATEQTLEELRDDLQQEGERY